MFNLRYGDSGDNTVENSSIFSLIQMCWLPSARACGQYNFAPKKILQFLTGGSRLRQVDLYKGRKTEPVVGWYCLITIIAKKTAKHLVNV